MEFGAIDNLSLASVNVYQRIVSVYGNVEAFLRFPCAFIPPEAGLATPGFFADRGASLLPQFFGEEPLLFLTCESRDEWAMSRSLDWTELAGWQELPPRFFAKRLVV